MLVPDRRTHAQGEEHRTRPALLDQCRDERLRRDGRRRSPARDSTRGRAEIAALWAKSGWPAQPDDSGTGITAPFNAPTLGPPPWFVYELSRAPLPQSVLPRRCRVRCAGASEVGALGDVVREVRKTRPPLKPTGSTPPANYMRGESLTTGCMWSAGWLGRHST